MYITDRIKGVVFGRTRIGDVVNLVYGIILHLRYSFPIYTSSMKDKQNYRAYLTKQYHIVEKGLSFKNSRQNFGKPKIIDLIKITERYISYYGEDDLVDKIKNCLKEYIMHNMQNPDEDTVYYQKVKAFVADIELKPISGTKVVYEMEKDNFSYEEFVNTRTTVRNFAVAELKIEEIQMAIEIARNTPSVCNRQGWQLHFYQNKMKMNQLLALQGGNTGFTDDIKGLFIITGDIKAFSKLEYNQLFTDGGLISMSLVFALHSLGIGSCCLNVCFPYLTEVKVKKVGNIPSSERLIMMIGVGYYNYGTKTAFSPKKSVDEILVIHE